MMAVIQWLNDLPVGTGAVIVIGGGIALAIIGTLIVNAYFTPAQLVSNNIIGGFKYAFLSSVYAGYIGLLLFGAIMAYWMKPNEPLPGTELGVVGSRAV